MSGFSPLDPDDISYMFSYWTGPIDGPQDPFHTGLVSISTCIFHNRDMD